METRRFYVVRAQSRGGTVTYNCPTPEWALRKLRDFKNSQYTDIVAVDPDRQTIGERALEALVSGKPEPQPLIPAPQA